ncbi:hypothetical protein I8H83_03190 [Candidatus Saccharibacteria bacterium]|nr:hypothetical protein [Candidatus Saccharibacteria bacterium]
MNTTFRIISDKSRYIVAALLVAFSVFVPMLASAATIEERSLELSSSTKTAANVSYGLTFTPVANAGAIVIDFCSDSPLIGVTCAAPGGLNVATATTSDGTIVAGETTASRLNVTKAITAGTPVNINFANITNPTDAGTVYARVLTYVDAAAAEGYDSGTVIGTPVDRGGVAFAITDGISVSGDVLETLSFCIAGAAIPDECDTTSLAAPTLQLGKDIGNGIKALQSDEVSEGDIFTQISTNAVGGAVVRLKSNAIECGGLVRAGAADNEEGCGIKPSLLADVTAVTPGGLFGVKLAAGTDTPAVSEGAFQAANTNYNTSNFRMNYIDGDLTGVTSVYGDSILNTNGAPALYKNMKLIFGAKADNNTIAGSYSADLSLIATGTF